MDFTAMPGHGLLTDLYELTMVQAHWREGRNGRAVFSLFPRSLPDTRNYCIACGLDDALSYLENLRFDDESLDYLRSLGQFSDGFLSWLGDFSFTGDVRAVPEGIPLFPGEPFMEISAPIMESQLAETILINRIHAQSLAATKCARVVFAAKGRPVLDFGLRRMHGTEAAVKNARAYYIAGAAATSNILAGKIYGIPVTGTMAHSYVQSHESEMDAFRDFVKLYPDTVLLIDTYDTDRGVENVIKLAHEMGNAFKVKGIRTDSGDMAEFSIRARRMLDDAGLQHVGIFASGNLDEYAIAELFERGALIDGFGVGTRMGVSADAPTIDFSYKLVAYDGRDAVKLATGKHSLPGRKQVYRIEEDGMAVRDVIAGLEESQPGRPLLVEVMRDGKRLRTDAADMHAARSRLAGELMKLPDAIRGIAKSEPGYPVTVSEGLQLRKEAAAEIISR